MEVSEFFAIVMILLGIYIVVGAFYISGHRNLQKQYASGNIAPIADIKAPHWFFKPAELFWTWPGKIGRFLFEGDQKT